MHGSFIGSVIEFPYQQREGEVTFKRTEQLLQSAQRDFGTPLDLEDPDPYVDICHRAAKVQAKVGSRSEQGRHLKRHTSSAGEISKQRRLDCPHTECCRRGEKGYMRQSNLDNHLRTHDQMNQCLLGINSGLLPPLRHVVAGATVQGGYE